MNAFIHHFTYDFKTGIRDRGKLLMNYLFPLVFFFLAGGLLTAVNPFFKYTMLPAMILFGLMSATLLGMPSSLVQARENGVFRSFRINGVPSGSLLAIPAIGTAIHMAVISILIFLAGPALFGGIAPQNVAGFAIAAVLSYVVYAGIGALIGVAAGKDTMATLIAQLFYIPSIILGGLMMPMSILPSGFQRLALLLPATHSMRLFIGLGQMPDGAAVMGVTGGQQAAAGGGALAGIGGALGMSTQALISLVVLGSSVILSFALAAVIFQWEPRASRPNRKAVLALLGIIPFAAAALLGV
jgi:ABC-2 type transport system permease protein